MATSESPNEYRLPVNTRPTHYDIVIKTDLEKLTFDGFVKIDLDVKEEISTIVLNTAELELGDASIHSNGLQTTLDQSSLSLNTVSERATWKIPALPPATSKVQFQIGFRGKLTGSMMGYYKSSWDDKGKKGIYALTQFEPTAARRAFPCWDEPLLKSTFAITLISRADTVNLSNMPAASEGPYHAKKDDEIDKWLTSSVAADETEKWKITKFETTPPMSTYIVAYANGPFEYLESSYKSPLSGKTRPLRIYATPDVIHQAQFALDVKARSLPLYEKVFDVEYALPKLDSLVAHDFDAGAMENWGLITGRTTALLLDPKKADISAQKQVASTQCHEVAHMWFGNVTTMEWWNYLYLNEGFATLMGEVIIANKLFPEWKMDSDFITKHLNRALGLDSKLSSHAIEVDCPDANHINQIFDSLSYSKAASVLRMLANYVGEDRFLKGVSLYLKKRLYGNSVTSDLWDGIGEATGLDVNKIMENWITKMGFPVLTVTETSDGIKVRQDRFLETGPAEEKDNETIWTIPLFLHSVDHNGVAAVRNDVVLDEREKTFPVDTTKQFKINAGTVGVYRVLYTPERLAKIASEAVKDGSIFTLNDRIGLVHDSLALAKSGFTKLSSSLTLVNILRTEQEFLVWDCISENLVALVSIWWEHPRTVDLLNAFRRHLFQPIVQKLGYEYTDSDSVEDSLLRTLAISNAAAAQDEGVTQELRNRFSHYMTTGDDSKIPADLQRVIYETAVKYGGREEYEAVKRLYEQPKTPTAGIAAVRAMGANPAFAKDTGEYILNKTRDQDVIWFFAGLSNGKTRRFLGQFFRDNYDVLCKRFEGNFVLKYFVEISFGQLSSDEDYQETAAFFKDKDTSKYSLALSQTLDGILAKSAYVKRSSEDISQWLEQWEQGIKS